MLMQSPAEVAKSGILWEEAGMTVKRFIGGEKA